MIVELNFKRLNLIMVELKLSNILTQRCIEERVNTIIIMFNVKISNTRVVVTKNLIR